MAVFYKSHEPRRRLGYSHTKPAYVVNDLHGPTSGTVALPVHIDWTPFSSHDLSEASQVRGMYSVVLREAGNEAEVAEWLDRGLLTEHWDELGIPGFVHKAWAAIHPELSQGRKDGNHEHHD